MLISAHTIIPMMSPVSTTIKLALLKNQAQRATRYFSQHVDEDKKIEEDFTLLRYWAVRDKYAATLKIRSEDGRDTITIWDAVNKGNARATRFFLSAGVDPNAQRELKPTFALSNGCPVYNESRTLLGQALRFDWKWNHGGEGWYLAPNSGVDHRSVIRLLLMQGANPNTPDTGLVGEKMEYHPFYHPLELKNYKKNKGCVNDPEIVTRLLEHGANPLTRDKETGRTSLHTNDQIEVVLRHVTNAEVDIRDNKGDTPLHWAARNRLLARAKLLYQHGANPYLQNEGKTPRDLVHDDEVHDDEAKNLFRLMELGEFERRTPGHHERTFEQIWLDIMDGVLDSDGEDLTRFEEDLKRTNAHGTSLLTWAVREQNYSAVRDILRCDRDFINKPDQFGLTPLHWAIYGDSDDIVRLLLNYGAKADIKDKFGQTSLDIAMTCGSPEVLKLLVQYNKS